MKIFQFTTSMSDGGAETLVVNYSTLLKEKGHEPVILTIYKVENSANHKRIMDAGIREISIFPNHGFFTRVCRTIFGNWLIPYRLKKIIQLEKPDCIHSHMQVLSYLNKVKDYLKDTKLFYTCHSEPDRFLRKGTKEYLSARSLIEKCNLQIIGLHNDMIVRLNELLSIDNAILINNGINFNKYIFNKDERIRTRDSLGITDEFLIGHIGRFTKVKNHDFIIKVFSEVLAAGVDSKLILIGSGPLENEIKEKVIRLGMESRVIFLSHRTDIPSLLMGMDAFVFPSLYEGLSLTLVEAQRMGLRCVISNRINIENVMSRKTFMLSIEDDPKEWAKKLLADDDNDFDESIEERILLYDLNNIVEGLLSLYKGTYINMSC